MTLSSKEINLLIKINIDKADVTIEEIEFYIKNDKLFTAVNRIYYGLFYALTAIALREGFSTSKHMQLISWFNKTFIHGDIVDKKYGRIIKISSNKDQRLIMTCCLFFQKNRLSQCLPT
jgi:uncharacterized protein (UPF0332 family)